MKSEIGVETVSRISGVFYLLMMTNSQWEKYLRREHNDFYHALLRQLIACRQQHIFVSEKGRYETPKEKYKATVNDGSWLIFHPRRKGGYRVHIKNMKKDYRKCIRCYASFLRADGIDNVDEMLYYILHYTFYHISFNRMLEKINYDKTRPMIDEVIKWIMKKDIDKVDKSKFIDTRKTAAPDEIYTNLGGISKARKSEKIRLTKQVQRKLTDKEIEEKYNPDLTNEENAANIGIGLTRLKQWKRENADRFESIEDKVKRLYNPELSWTKNADIIGYSVNTIKKYINKKENPIAVVLETPDTTKTFGTAELKTADNKNQLDADDDELISWVMEYDFTEKIEIENTDSNERIEHNVNQEEAIAVDFGTAELETEDSKNQFAGLQSIDNDDYCRWLFGDEFMETIEMERKKNALFYGTEEVVKMVI